MTCASERTIGFQDGDASANFGSMKVFKEKFSEQGLNKVSKLRVNFSKPTILDSLYTIR